MANSAQVNGSGGPVFWSITVSQLKVATYQAKLMAPNGTVLEKWTDQRTDDSLPDRFQISSPPASLPGCILSWDSYVMDPTDKGGGYVGTVAVDQDGRPLCVESASGQIPSGNGKADLYADEIRFL